MIRKFLAREGKFLLEELGAPNFRTLLWRAVFWVCFAAFVGGIIFGVLAVGEAFGLRAMYAAIFLLFLLCIRLERRTPVYFDDGDPFMLGGDKALPPPGTQALPAPGPRQITRSHRPALPGPKK